MSEGRNQARLRHVRSDQINMNRAKNPAIVVPELLLATHLLLASALFASQLIQIS